MSAETEASEEVFHFDSHTALNGDLRHNAAGIMAISALAKVVFVAVAEIRYLTLVNRPARGDTVICTDGHCISEGQREQIERHRTIGWAFTYLSETPPQWRESATRETGYYWVVTEPGAKPEPAEWDGEQWWLIGNEIFMREDGLESIGAKMEVPE